MKQTKRLLVKFFFIIVGIIFVVIGIIGLVFPILPGFILIFLGITFFARGSENIDRLLRESRLIKEAKSYFYSTSNRAKSIFEYICLKIRHS